MAQRRASPKQPHEVEEHILRFDGGLNSEHPALLDSREASVAKNLSFERRGTLASRAGIRARYGTPFGTGPVLGLSPFYKGDRTTRLVAAAADKLYYDLPHLLFPYDSQAEWESGSRHNVDLASNPGSVELAFPDDPTFVRASVAYAKRRLNLLGANQASVETDTAGFSATAGAAISRDTAHAWHGSASLEVATAGAGMLEGFNADLQPCNSSKTYTASCYVRGEGAVKVGIKTTDSGVSAYRIWSSPYTLTGDWQRLSVSWTTATDSTAIALGVQTGSEPAQAIVFCVDGLQINEGALADWQMGGDWLVAENAPRYGEGKFGQAALIEESTYNRLHYNQSSVEYNASGLSVFGAGSSRSRVTTESYLGVASLRVVTDGAAEWQGYVTGSRTCLAETTYTCSQYARGTAGEYWYPFVLQNNGPQLAGDAVLMTGDWQRVVHIITTGTGVTRIQMGLATGPNNWAQTVYVDCLQIEQKAFPTSWQIGSDMREAEALSVLAAGVLSPTAGTVEAWIYYCSEWSSAPAIRQIFEACRSDGGQDAISLYYSKGDQRLYLKTWSGGASPSYAYKSMSGLSDGWHYVAATWDVAESQIFIDGAAGTSVANPDLPSALAVSAYIGSDNGATHHLNSLIDDLRISSRARTASEIEAAYLADAPLTWDEHTTYLLRFDSSLALPPERQGCWQSPSQNAGQADDPATLRVSWEAVVPPATALTCQVRTSSDGSAWSGWFNQANGGLAAAPSGTYSQVRFIPECSDGASTPELQSCVVAYDGTPEMGVLATGLHAGADYCMITAMDRLLIANGYDDLRKWDGTIPPPDPLPLVGGSPPRARWLAWHQNRAWAAGDFSCPSRLYFSDVLDVDTWPVLNFIDIDRDDGYYLTGIIQWGNYLVVCKQASISTLAGYSAETFMVKRWETELGCLAPRSLCIVNGALSFLSRNGIYLWNAGQKINVCGKLRTFWRDELNHQRLDQAAAVFFGHKLHVALPAKGSNTNDLVLTYDVEHGAVSIDEASKWAASCWAVFSQYGGDLLLHGSASAAQLYEHKTTLSDDAGDSIVPRWRSKSFNFGAPKRTKFAREAVITCACGPSARTLLVGFCADGQEPSSFQAFTVPGSAAPKTATFSVLPARSGVRFFKELAMEIRTDGDPLEVHELVLGAVVRGEAR